MADIVKQVRHRLWRWWTVDGEIPRLKERNRQLAALLAAARSARFEHGHSGAVR